MFLLLRFSKDSCKLEESIDFLKIVYALVEKENDKNLKKQYNMRAFEIAKLCLEFNPDNYLSHKWY